MEDVESGVNRVHFWIDRPVLVTGATGLLGGWLAKRLLRLGAEVVCLVRDWVPQSELYRAGIVAQTNVVRGDVRDAALIERVLNEYEISTVYHLAAQTIVGVANMSPPSTFDTNIRGTWTVLEACRRSPVVRQVVVASSDKAYGDCGLRLCAESDPVAGEHPYDVSKSCADLIARTYAKTYQLPIAVTRCGNLYGGGDLNWNRLIPGTIRSILRGQRPLIRSDGSYVRDYFYAEDAAAAYTLLAEQLSADESLFGEAFNFAGGEQAAVIEIVKRICDLMRSDLEPDIRNEVSNEIPYQRLSTEKAIERLGWQPLFTLEQGLQLTIDWYRDYFDTIGEGLPARGGSVVFPHVPEVQEETDFD